jgi:transcriptional regulator GlxA family with amidase domain
MTKRIGLIGYDICTALDLVAPLEAFQTANDCLEGGAPAYAPIVLSADGKVFSSESGLVLGAHASFADAPALDTLIVPGGPGLREPAIGAPVIKFLKARARGTRRIASVCTGLYGLAAAGLMDGRNATTHWRFASRFREKFPKVKLDTDAIYLRDGKFYSSAGVTAGIDLSLALIADDLGEKLALKVARELVVYLKRPGGQTQFSEPLQFQTRAVDGFADLAGWMLRNLKQDLSVEILAARVNLGVRHFSRRFAIAFGVSPAAYVERLRLDEARKRLPSRNQTMDSVAASVGYASADAFRRAFERRFGIAPSVYKKNFAG